MHVKTAISLEKTLFDHVNRIARKFHITRSSIFEKAVKEYIEKKENKELLEKINSSVNKSLSKEEKEFLKETRQHFGKITEEKW